MINIKFKDLIHTFENHYIEEIKVLINHLNVNFTDRELNESFKIAILRGKSTQL